MSDVARRSWSIFPLLVAFSAAAVAIGRENEVDRTLEPYLDERFSCEGRADGRLHNHARESSGYSGFRIVADLNFDGREDLILSMGQDPADGDGGCTNAGCAANIYLKQGGGGYRRIDFFVHPLAVRSARVSGQVKHGLLMTYHRLGADDGAWGIDQVDALAVTRVAVLKVGDSAVTKSEEDEALTRAEDLRAEFSYCKEGRLEWRDTF